jgi:type I restriction enzyme S subunit
MISKSITSISKKVSSGLTPLRSNPAFWNSRDIPWVKTEQLGVKYIYDCNEKCSKLVLEETGLKLNPINTLSIAMYGEGKTRGSVSILRREMTTNQACCNVVIDENKANYEYVYYFLKTQYNQLRNLSSGVRKNLNSNDIKNFEIRLPESIEEQNQIAKVLSDLDAKIELNNKINAQLEAMAKLIYDYWFVQFDFPDAKGKPYKSSGGKMEFNKELKREIPEGWEVKRLGGILHTELGGTPSTKNPEYWDGDLPWLNSGEIANFPIIESELKITEKAIAKSATALMPAGTCPLSITRHLRPSILGIDACANQSVVGVFESENIKSSYIYPYLVNEIPRLMTLRSGAQQPHINKKTVDDSLMIIPSQEIQSMYHQKVGSLYQKIVNSAKENQKLSELRDWLLPMLMNGQVRVGEKESNKFNA